MCSGKTHTTPQCAQAGLSQTSAGIETLGACGMKALVFFTKLFDRYAKRRGGPGLLQKQGQPQRECWKRLLVVRRGAIGDQLYRGLRHELDCAIEIPSDLRFDS